MMAKTLSTEKLLKHLQKRFVSAEKLQGGARSAAELEIALVAGLANMPLHLLYDARHEANAAR